MPDITAATKAALLAIAADIMRSKWDGALPDEWDHRLTRWAVSLRNLADGQPPGPLSPPLTVPRAFA